MWNKIKFCGPPQHPTHTSWSQVSQISSCCAVKMPCSHSCLCHKTVIAPHPSLVTRETQTKMLKRGWIGLAPASLGESFRKIISNPNICLLSHTDGIRLSIVCSFRQCPNVLIGITSFLHPPFVVKKYFRCSQIKGLWSSLSEHTDGLLSGHGPQ